MSADSASNTAQDRFANLAAKLEALIFEDRGKRGLITDATKTVFSGQLAGAAKALAALNAGAKIGLFTGFPILDADPVAPESDGPPGTEWLAECLTQCGFEVTLFSEAESNALFADNSEINLVEMPLGAQAVKHCLPHVQDMSALIAIERVGQAYDRSESNAEHSEAGYHCYSMRLVDLRDKTARIDPLFNDFAGLTIGIGDGGNEVGMGLIDPNLLAPTVANASQIACQTKTQYCIGAAISNWGAYCLGALVWFLSDAPKRPDWSVMLTVEAEQERLRRMLERGMIDGVTREASMSVDGLPWEAQVEFFNQLNSATSEA